MLKKWWSHSQPNINDIIQQQQQPQQKKQQLESYAKFTSD